MKVVQAAKETLSRGSSKRNKKIKKARDAELRKRLDEELDEYFRDHESVP